MENLNYGDIINLLAVLAISAAVAGFMAGLLGVGGGIIMVPALYYAFTVLDFELATRMHLAVGTSLAIIIPTSIISTKTHMEHDAVDFKMVKSFGLFILIGVILGTFLAVNLKTPALVLFFSIFAFMVGLFFIFLREKLVENPKTISKIKNILGDLKDQDAIFLKSQDLKLGDSRIIKNKEAITKLVAHYIVNEKNEKGLPVNDVSRFHLGNGAIVDDIVINANISENGFKRSYGVMVNYLYELKNIEKNHEEYMNNNKVIVSDKIKKYL